MRFWLLFFSFFSASAAGQSDLGYIVSVTESDAKRCTFQVQDMILARGQLADWMFNYSNKAVKVSIVAKQEEQSRCVQTALETIKKTGFTNIEFRHGQFSNSGVFVPIQLHPALQHPEAKPFDESANATEQLDTALDRAELTDKRVIVVMGANWCHDSRGLAGWFVQPRFAAMLEAKYEIVYVDVGHRDRNIDIARRFGLKSIKGTPTVLVLSSSGVLLNRKSAPKWRDAASREEDAIFAYFDQFIPEP